MDLVTLIPVIAFLLIAVGMGSRSGNPWPMLAGFLLVGLGVAVRLFSGGGFYSAALSMCTDMGLGLVLAAAWLSLKRPRLDSGPFFALGAGLLALAGVMYLGGRLLGVQSQASILVELGPDDSIAEIAPVLDRFDAAHEQAFPAVDMSMSEDLAQTYVLSVRQASARKLMRALGADRENVDHVAWNAEVEAVPIMGKAPGAAGRASYLEDDPRVSEQWALEAIRGHEAHAMLVEAAPARAARLAILDTGIDAVHEDLEAVMHAGSASSDANGHGTHCAGIAAAATNNGIGIASLNWDGAFVQLGAYSALGEDGSGTLDEIAQAVIDASLAEADVISMSLGSFADEPPRILVLAVRLAQRRGAIVVASAGNANEDAARHFPSNITGVIAVAAVDQELRKAQFSNTVASLERPIAAPGVDILSSYPGSAYDYLSGTSMAAPLVAGLIGVMRALDPDISADAAYGILHETGTAGPDASVTGRTINAEAALRTLQIDARQRAAFTAE